MRPVRRICAALIVAVCLLACPRGVSAQMTDWPTYAFDEWRTGYNPRETTLGVSNARQVKHKWRFDAAAFDAAHGFGSSNAVFLAAPIFASRVPLSQGATDLVLVGDTNGVFFALDGQSSNPAGTIVWSRSLSLASTTVTNHCYPGDHNGILSSAVLDRHANGGAGVVYVAFDGFVHALSLVDGTPVAGWPADGLRLPVSMGHDSFVKGAPNLSRGILYIATAAVCDRVKPYYGQLIAVDTATPFVLNQWFTLGGSAQKPAQDGGSIWGVAGVAIAQNTGLGGVLVGTGNGQPIGGAQEAAPFAEHLVKLSPDLLTVIEASSPITVYNDSDFGGSPMVFSPKSCNKPGLVAIPHKAGSLFVYGLGSIGTVPPLDIQVGNPNDDRLQGVAAWDPVNQLLYVTTPTSASAQTGSGLLALRAVSNCQLQLAWQTNTTPQGKPLITKGNITPPVAANGIVYFGVRDVTASGVYAVAAEQTAVASPGQIVWNSGPEIAAMIYAEPIVANGHVFVAVTDGSVHAYGL